MSEIPTRLSRYVRVAQFDEVVRVSDSLSISSKATLVMSKGVGERNNTLEQGKETARAHYARPRGQVSEDFE